MYNIGIDFGGTKLESVILDHAGKEIFRKRVPTHAHKGYESIIANIAALYRDTASRIDHAAHSCGVGIPGALSTRTERIKNSNTTCTIGKPLQRDLAQSFGHAVAIENDANCFAMAEARYGAGRGCEMVFGAILGTGCGGGIVFRGDTWNGHMAVAGEWGHTTIDPEGHPCYCGQRGCVETYLSGGGMQTRYSERTGSPIAFKDIAALYDAGDETSRQFMEEFFVTFGKAVSNLIATLDPNIIVLGGGVSNFKAIYTRGIAEVEKRVFSDHLDTPIVQNELGDSAGVLGAALIGKASSGIE